MLLSAGARLGPYEILAPLGAGGMGEVYRAHDTRLNRDVAVKILPPALAEDSDRLRRFRQEAQAAGSLNHPNVTAVYDVGQADGFAYVVTELLLGETLRARLAGSSLPVRKAIDYGIQAARGLAAAHAKGATHRDIKPENLFVTNDGFLKILDFGLAKLGRSAAAAPISGPTATLETLPGIVVGTTGYMSPEQVRGDDVNHLSDLFSLGVVIYEMLSGTRPFAGASSIETLNAILKEDPTPLPAAVPPALDRIVRRCLEKKPEERFESARDLAFALESISEDDVRPKPRPPARSTWTIAAAMLLVLAAGVAAGWFLSRKQRPAAYASVKPLTTFSGNVLEPALSPDGKQVAFAWDGPARDNYDIYIQLVESGALLRLTTDPAADRAPAWSPDGQRLAFIRGDAVYLIPALGGVERRLAQFPPRALLQTFAGSASSISWSPDSRFLAVNSTVDGSPAIWLVSTESGEYRALPGPPKGYYMVLSPAFSPDGHTLAYISARDTYSRAVVLQPIGRDGVAAGAGREITSYDRRFEHLAWQADGRGLVLVVRTMGQRSELYRLSPRGELTPLGIDNGILDWPSVSAGGNRLAYQKREWDTNIYRMDGPGPDGGPRLYRDCHVAAIVDSTAQDREPALSPDGRRLAFNSDRLGYYEIHEAAADGSRPVVLTSVGPISLGSPRWSPDSLTIAFDRYASGRSGIFTINAGGGKPFPVIDDGFRNIRPSYSHDGKWIYFSSNRSGRLEIWKVPPAGGSPQQVTHNSGIEPFESPDGSRLYYTNIDGLWTVPPDGGDPTLVLKEPVFLLYTLAGRSIYYAVRNPPALWVLRTDTGRKFEYVRFPDSALGQDGGTVFSVSADERTIAFSRTDRLESNLMLVENFR